MPAAAANAARALLTGREGQRALPQTTAREPRSLERRRQAASRDRRQPAAAARPAAMDLFDFFRDWDLEQQW